jgi:hypothetical protein
MNLDQKLTVLNKIYGLYKEVVENLDVACKKFCASCCTADVTMTTLEGYLIVHHMISNDQTDLYKIVQTNISENRFRPKITFNSLADLYMKEDDPPEEEKNDSINSCPVLNQNLCPIYGVRPFGCRCFTSTHDCGKAGYAQVDPFALTLNTLFMQFIEHIDFTGFSGNFADILLLMISQKNQTNYKINALRDPGTGFVSNIKIKVLMIPPEHRKKVKPVLSELLNISRPVG